MRAVWVAVIEPSETSCVREDATCEGIIVTACHDLYCRIGNAVIANIYGLPCQRIKLVSCHISTLHWYVKYVKYGRHG